MHILIVGDAGEDYLMNMVSRLKEFDRSLEFSALHVQPDIRSLLRARSSGVFTRVFSYYSNPGIFSIVPKIHGIQKRLVEEKVDQRVFQYPYQKVFLFGFWPPAVRFYQRNKARIPYLTGYMMGSDFIRMSERSDIEEFLSTANACKKIIAGSPVLLKKIQESGKIVRPELHMHYIGHGPLDEMEKIRDISTVEAKRHFGINPDDLVITVGYNASPNQQHEAVIEALSHTRLPENTLLLFPLGYGGSKEYIRRIAGKLKSTGLHYRLLEQYYSEKEIAVFRYASEIFIHSQKTDNLSGSVQEHLYAGNAVITGSWHPYSVLKERGIKFFEFDSFDDLPEIIEDIIENLGDYLQDVRSHNRSEKFEKGFWRYNISDWHRAITTP